MKVLVVEDVEMNIGLMREVFQLWFGIGFTVARDGLEAVEKIKTGGFDLVFMDLQLPRLGGIEATRRVRELGLTVPIVALTANALSEDVERARAAGMNGYITKPVRRAELTRALYRHVPGAPASEPTPRPHVSPPAKGPPRARLSGTVRLSLPPAMLSRRRTQELSAQVPLPPKTAEVVITPEPLRDRARRHFEATFGPTRVERLLMLSMDGVRAKMIELHGACAEDERAGIAAALHGIRGVLLNSGLDELGDRVGELEREAKDGRAPHPDKLARLLEALRDYVGQEES
jgi:CheY-like chemotaxis protein